MDGQPNDPRRQFSAAWQAATAALGEWRQQVSAATSDAKGKLDPAIRAAAEAARAAVTGDWRARPWPGTPGPPANKGRCDGEGVLAPPDRPAGRAGGPPGAAARGGPGASGCAPL